MKARTNILTSIVSMGLVGMLLLTACSMIPQVLPRSGGAGTPPAQAPAATGGANQGSIPATGSQPGVTVNDQSSDGSSVVVAKVISKGPGWIAIHTQQNGQMGEVIGYTPVKDGENDNVTVKIDSSKVTPTMYAMLHVDAGVVGKYEFPGPDVPFMSNGQMVSPSFHLTMGASSGATPLVTIKDQDASSGKVVVDDVVSNGLGWLAVHIQMPDGSVGPEIGYTAVRSGDNKNVTVTIDASKATGTMYAMLHVDAGTPGIFENPGPDVTATLNGQMVGAPFKNSTSSTAVNSSTNSGSSMPGMAPTEPAGEYANQPTAQATQPSAATPTQMQASSQPTATASGGGTGMAMATPSSGATPLVKVSDQQMQNGTVKIDDVMSQGPGWIVVYTVKNGQPDQPIGETHVNDGDNQNVVVKIDTSKGPVDTLYAQLHVDAGTIGTFEFPGPDAPVMMGVQMISGMFKTNVNVAASAPTPTSAPTPVVTIKDQAIHNGAVVVAHIVAIGDSWIVIHPQNPDGSMGDMIGAAAIHDGANDNVIVHIDTNRATKTMYAMLHVNVSKASYPQFPGVDVPVMVAGKMVAPGFNIIGPVYGDIPLAVNKNSAGVSYLTDGLGMTLYLSLNDQPGTSNCTGDCLKQWHPLLATGAIIPGNGVTIAKIGVIFLPDRTRQVTYNGSPLYYFAGDQVPGDTKGQGVGGNWFLVTP